MICFGTEKVWSPCWNMERLYGNILVISTDRILTIMHIFFWSHHPLVLFVPKGDVVHIKVYNRIITTHIRCGVAVVSSCISWGVLVIREIVFVGLRKTEINNQIIRLDHVNNSKRRLLTDAIVQYG